ncbi:nicotinate-nucleotide--dimethylbenzimidazole phosphoribosyltransferase [Streptomyces sp. SID486]|uniref:nicotinate-nucleotide--dimethylbenzimidazole phosphoribosyltransferase n=1 Tax=Streptomyces sp. SID486 TaxID=2690264 RepID=UPI0031F6F925
MFQPADPSADQGVAQTAGAAVAEGVAEPADPATAPSVAQPTDPAAAQDVDQPAPAEVPAPTAEPGTPEGAAVNTGAGLPAQPGVEAPAVGDAVPGAQPAVGEAVPTAQPAVDDAVPAAQPAVGDAVPAAQAAVAQAQQPGTPAPEVSQPQPSAQPQVLDAEVPQAAADPAAPDAVPTPPAGDGTQATEPSEPAVLQVQGPQLAQNAPHGTGTATVTAVAQDQAPATVGQAQGTDPAPAAAGQAPAASPAPATDPTQAAAPAPATDPTQAAAPEQSSAPAQGSAPAATVDAPPSAPQLQSQAADAASADPGADPQHGQAAQAEQLLPSGLPGEPEQPLGLFVPVEGQVPTTPHLAPTPPQPLVLPPEGDAQGPQGPHEQPEPAATVPAPREGEPAAVPDAEHAPGVVQHADDLRTRGADQEEGTPAVTQARQPTGPAAPGYADAEREAVLKVMRERRDIRNGFRSDPIPHEVLLRVLEAAHTAPSVGHSQPWDFVVIRSAETRRTMHELAMRQREAYAKSLPKGRAKQFKELKIEAILDTPVNIVVTADPTRGGRHTLGRHTQPQMAPYSSALAVENLWLAARAEGLGVGWVSFFDEREMVRALGLPEHLEAVAYLCVGYVDEFPDEPELMQAGWSKRRPLSWVVHEETYGRRALPGEEPHDLLAETVAQIRPLDAKALGEAWERQKRMTKPAGALGMLEIISAQLSGLSRQCPPPIPEPAAVAIFAGDHGVHAQGVTPWPQEVTAQMVANFLGGGAVCNAFAAQVGAEVCVVDVGVAADLPATPGLLPRKIRGGTSDMTAGPAMTREEAKAAIEVGIETARDLVAAGNKALLTGEMGIANTTASAALISVFTGADPAEVTGRGTGINDETLARKTEVIRRALELHQPDPADPIGVLAAIGGFEHAAMVGLLLGGASLRTPVILDGVSAGAAALVARAIAPEVLAACIAGHRSAEPGHMAALNKLGLRPLVDLDLRLGEGTGALLALPLVQSTARAMHEVATFDSAGVTEK